MAVGASVMAGDRLQVLREPLEQLGFRKRAGQIYTMDLGGEIAGWLGLNTATKHHGPGQVEVNPVAGVRHQTVERVVAELLGQRPHGYQLPTVSTPIGYVMPDHKYTAWLVRAAAPAWSAGELVKAVADYGLPFMRSLVELPQLQDAIERGMGHQLEYRLPVVLALRGERSRADDVLTQAVDQLGDRQDAAAAQFRRFAEAFHDRERMSS